MFYVQSEPIVIEETWKNKDIYDLWATSYLKRDTDLLMVHPNNWVKRENLILRG